MNANLDCLSLMELLDLRNGGGDAGAQEHLDSCPRCRALLSAFPPDLTVASPEKAPPGPVTDATRRRPAGAVGVSTGAVWRALADGTDVAWVVIVIGHASGGDDRIMVVPVCGDPDLATSEDLLLEPSVLGYRAFADVGNAGVLLREQLVEPIGRLEEAAARALVGFYRAVIGGEPTPETTLGGPIVLDADDLRLLAADERRLTLRPLWRRADRLVDAEQQAEPLEQPAPAVAPTVAVLLERHLIGAHSEWDRATLLEESGTDGKWLDAFMKDRLDLTDRRDVEPLARIFSTLKVDTDTAAPAIIASLEQSQGGSRQAEGPVMPMAARSQPGMTEDEVTEALYADQSTVDRSPEARRAAIKQYIADFRSAMDELE